MENANNKDLMIKFKSVEMKKNSKGGDYLVLKLTSDEAKAFVEELTTKVTERGIRLDVHVSDKETDDGRTFKSGITFVKGIQEFGKGGFNAAAPRASAPRVPVTASSSTLSKIEALKQAK